MSTSLPSQEYQPAPQAPAQKGSGLGIAALILGIITLFICLIPVINNAAYLTGLAAIVLGFLGRRGIRAGKGMALAGIITGALGIVGAIISTILYVSVLNGVSDALDEAAKPVSGASASSSTTSSSSETTPADTESASDDAPAGPTTFKVGETASVTLNGSDGAETTVTKVLVSKRSFGSFGEKPKNGTFKVVTVTAANTGEEAYDVNPFDWYYLGADGTKYQYGDDNAIMSGYEGKDFNGSTLNKGEKTSGTMVFDVPAKAVKLVYAPNFDSEPLAIWITK